ncbi:MAG TPA: hypothetical protein VM912_17530 [Terriglobales bacterium]|nr:hypothetical protein [Terriglobales bacterium]
MVEFLQELAHSPVEFHHGKELAMAEGRQNPAFGNQDTNLDFRFGEKRLLQTVAMMAHKFSPSPILSIH